jgi:penicillin amidase
MNAEWTSYAPDTKLIVTSFVRGLNAYVALVKDKPPIEYTMLGFQPTPFTDDMPLQRMAALSMTGNATTEIERATLIRVLGNERAEQLFPLETRARSIPRLALTTRASVLRPSARSMRPIAASTIRGSTAPTTGS